ncbi:hypothetical protein [Streptomyces cacaoi]|uniref:hypothetical protein n=1 Tax=Streptomyces cacaoi TaxID=1898 RepID=UPI00374A1208
MTDGGDRPPRARDTAAPGPVPGSAVHDPDTGRIGVVAGRAGTGLRLCPLGGGGTWQADPRRVRLLTHAELLSARVAEANARTRRAMEVRGESVDGRGRSGSAVESTGL